MRQKSALLLLLLATSHAFPAEVPFNPKKELEAIRESFERILETALVVEQTGKRVAQLSEQFSEFTCTETVSQSKLDARGKVFLQRKSVFDSFVTMQLSGDDMNVEESRLLQGKVAKEKETEKSLLVTNGFSTLLLIFHPYFQNSFEFAPLTEEKLDGRRLQRIQFQHVRGARSPSVLQLRGRDYPLEWQGMAWIEPESGSVVKISVALKTSMEDVGLKRLSGEVRYAPVKFQDWKEAQWLPSLATIEAETTRQHWRNSHQFANYRLFSVSTSVTTEEPH